MLRRDERRSLEQIEQRLAAESPELAQGLADHRRPRKWTRMSPRSVLAAVVIVLAVVLVFLSQFPAAFAAAVLATVLLVTRDWHVQT